MAKTNFPAFMSKQEATIYSSIIETNLPKLKHPKWNNWDFDENVISFMHTKQKLGNISGLENHILRLMLHGLKQHGGEVTLSEAREDSLLTNI